MGLIVRCDVCGREDISTVYYVGKRTTHCLDDWIAIVQALPHFNIDAKLASMKQIEEDAVESTLRDIPLNELHNYIENGERPVTYDIEIDPPIIAPEIPKAPSRRPAREYKVVSLDKVATK